MPGLPGSRSRFIGRRAELDRVIRLLGTNNIVAALDRSLGHGDPGQGLTIAAAMWWYWWVTGRVAEGRSWLGRALAAAPATPTPPRGQALRGAASLARSSGDLAAARALGEQSLAVFRELGDRPGTITALNSLSITAQGQQDYDGSLSYGYGGLALAEQDGDRRGIAAAMNNTAGTLRCAGRLDEAGPLFERALAVFREISDPRGEAAALNNLGIVSRRRGRLAASAGHMRAALRLYTDLAIVEGQVDAVEGLAQLAVLDGDPARGLTLLLLAARERVTLGSSLFTPDEVADRDSAERAARESLTADEITRAVRAAAGTTLDAAVALLCEMNV
ncbi:tetratricopeptide repeat protein [Actinoplanes palleronii]|uniref:Tetratricopeptide repeat protein n=1 Tax=Actinoplanes palleronii TaxID=113570 RepID=A0ABQ4B1A0_9ACTN|nr:tetratricopeptide repeat protein [Actinoplanes palleronii]GIE64448.1 hypothetical protein Apa02nite_005560 [Actinoplanes palleronii]